MTKVVALQHCTLKTQQSQGFLFVTFFLISVTNITNSLFSVSQKSSEKASELSHIQIRSYECSICLFFILVRFFNKLFQLVTHSTSLVGGYSYF